MNDRRQLRIVAIETSGRVGSVAIGEESDFIAAASFSTVYSHAVELVPTVDRLLSHAGWSTSDLDEIYVSIGPGSFTGLRVGVTVSRSLSYATGARIVAVPTLEAIAGNAVELSNPPPEVAVILDAKRKQVYGALFRHERDRYCGVSPPMVVDPLKLLRSSGNAAAVMGEGVPFHQEAIACSAVRVLEEAHWPARARQVFVIGRRMAAAGRYTHYRDLVPLYLRRPEAEEVWERRHPETRSS